MSFIDEYRLKTQEEQRNYLVTAQMANVDARLKQALQENLHSITIDHAREIPLMREVRERLQQAGFHCTGGSCLHQGQDALKKNEQVFFPHVDRRKLEVLLSRK